MTTKRYWMLGALVGAALAAPPALAQEEADEADEADEAAEESAEDADEADEAAEEPAEAEDAEAAAQPAEDPAEDAEDAEPAEEGEEAEAAEEAPAEPEPPEEDEVEVAPEADDAPEVDPTYEADDSVRARIHAITTRNVYTQLRLDVYDAETGELVGTGRTTDRAAGEAPLSFDLPPGIYKIVRAGDAFDTFTDFATMQLDEEEAERDFVIVVDPSTRGFRGSGVVTDELPEGVEIAGVRIALNAGGSLAVHQQRDVVGQTSGVHGLYGLFANLSMVFDRDNHFLNVGSDLELNLLDRPAASVYATSDRFSADALYAYNIQNPYIGPYVRGSFRTAVFPSYLFLDSGIGPEQEESADISVTRELADGTSEERIYGTKGTQDNLRVRLADPFAPVILQQELGANLRALTADLVLLDVDVGTRLGWAFRQGLVRDEGLFTVDGDETGQQVVLTEVEGYHTTGPTIGANATVTFARWLFGSANLGIIAPIQNIDDAGDNFGERLLVDLSANAGFRVPVLTDLLHATFDYTFRLERDGYLTSATQIDQNVMGRLSVNFF